MFLVAALIAATVGVLLAHPARALDVKKATLSHGEVKVSGGDAAGSATITWEGNPVASASKAGNFHFQSGAVPADCVGTLSDGVETLNVPVSNCTTLAFPATGQQTCWNGAGAVIPCAGTGQDGEFQAGAPLAYTDSGDGTITDVNTGLMWEKNSDDGSIHDKDNLYTFPDALAIHIAGLNTPPCFAGHCDWRLPNLKELQSLLNYENRNPAVSPAFDTNCAGATVLTGSCTDSVSAGYWASTHDAVRWIGLNFGLGITSGTNKPGPAPEDCVNPLALCGPVRAVRGGLGVASPGYPASGQETCWNSVGAVIPCAGTGQDGDTQAGAPLAYTDNGDGTITDNNTGLVWAKKSDDGSLHDWDNTYTWADAFDYVADLNAAQFAGHTDWRLPNLKELQSIVNYGQQNPAVSSAFNNGCVAGASVLTGSCTKSNNYWASTSVTPDVGDPPAMSHSRGVVFGSGFDFIFSHTETFFVRAVRGGRVEPLSP